ncbi:MAG: DUF3858 domain-containing protein, partial [Bacteroidota bacterium]|nr:DUF3858 domain-containing protein [Bacteroidota bacterium]
ARSVVGDNDNEIERAKKIYSFIRDHFKVTSRNWGIDDNSTLEKVNKDRTGNVAEINLLLIALLRSQKLEADPVILATRDNGLTNASYPVMDNYNYTICRLIVNGKIYCLDASVSTLGFGKLPTECYNGYARVITKNNNALLLSPDSINESESIIISIENEDGKKPLNLYWTEQAGYYRSSEIRSAIKQKSVETYTKSLSEKSSVKGKIDSFSIDNLNDFNQPLSVSFKTSIDPGNEDHFYFNPLLGTGLKENPFKAAERSYPVELPYTSDKIFVLNMEVPAGYEVEELPKSTKITLNDSEGFFEYRIQKNANTIQFRSLINIKKATFEPEDYNTLKDFYAAIIKKQGELIVFKKIQR